MANPEHLSKLKEGVEAWNRWREENPQIRPDLEDAKLFRKVLDRVNFSNTELRTANLIETSLVEADLREAKLQRAELYEANLSRANLSGAEISDASLNETILCEANLKLSALTNSDLTMANLEHANLRFSNLFGAVLRETNLNWADISDADLDGALFDKASLKSAKLYGVSFGNTTFMNVDLSTTIGIEAVKHFGPSCICPGTITLSASKLPEVFLRGCGLSPWEIEIVRLYDPSLTPSDVDEILSTRIYQNRVDGPLYIGGVFISYSHADSAFVDKLYKELQDTGVSVWLDQHDMLAGNIERQVMRQIRLKDIVLLVLSENSLKSDWVETELEEARAKEKVQERDVLCPVAIDDSWEEMEGVLWRKLKRDKHILDFSAWETEGEFKRQFDRLIKGMQINYPQRG